MLINHDEILGIIQSYRLCWICGRFSGGKTSLAYKLGESYLKQGYRLLTNNKSIWADPIQSVTLLNDGSNFMHSVHIYDEGGLYFKGSRQIEQVCSYAAKMDNIFMLPSFWPPTRAAQVVMVQPLYNLKKIGLPLIVYQWKVNMKGFRDEGKFYWLFPQEIYGIYSRRDPGADPEAIIQHVIQQTQEFIEREGGKSKPNGIFDVEQDFSEAGAIEDLISVMEENIVTGEALAKRNSKRRR